MPFEHLSKLVYGVVLPEEVSLLIFDPLFESEDGRQLGARSRIWRGSTLLKNNAMLRILLALYGFSEIAILPRPLIYDHCRSVNPNGRAE